MANMTVSFDDVSYKFIIYVEYGKKTVRGIATTFNFLFKDVQVEYAVRDEKGIEFTQYTETDMNARNTLEEQTLEIFKHRNFKNMPSMKEWVTYSNMMKLLESPPRSMTFPFIPFLVIVLLLVFCLMVSGMGKRFLRRLGILRKNRT